MYWNCICFSQFGDNLNFTSVAPFTYFIIVSLGDFILERRLIYVVDVVWIFIKSGHTQAKIISSSFFHIQAILRDE